MHLSKSEEKLYDWWIVKLNSNKRWIIVIIAGLASSFANLYIYGFLEVNAPEFKSYFLFLVPSLIVFFFSYGWTRGGKSLFKHLENSMRDPLTGLHNRLYLEESLRRLQKQVLRDIRKGQQTYLILVFMDIDKFKNINDSYGHAFGDSAICTCAEIMRQEIREDTENYLCRYGGDEFCAALKISNSDSEIEALNEVSIICQRIHENLSKTPFYCKSMRILLSITMGIHVFNPNEDIMEALSRADAEMYAKKHKPKLNEIQA